MKDIIEIFKSLEDSGLSVKGVRKTIQHEAEEQKGGFLSMLLGTLGASLLGTFSRKRNKQSCSRNCRSWLLKQKDSKSNNKKTRS